MRNTSGNGRGAQTLPAGSKVRFGDGGSGANLLPKPGRPRLIGGTAKFGNGFAAQGPRGNGGRNGGNLETQKIRNKVRKPGETTTVGEESHGRNTQFSHPEKKGDQEDQYVRFPAKLDLDRRNAKGSKRLEKSVRRRKSRGDNFEQESGPGSSVRHIGNASSSVKRHATTHTGSNG